MYTRYRRIDDGQSKPFRSVMAAQNQNEWNSVTKICQGSASTASFFLYSSMYEAKVTSLPSSSKTTLRSCLASSQSSSSSTSSSCPSFYACLTIDSSTYSLSCYDQLSSRLYRRSCIPSEPGEDSSSLPLAVCFLPASLSSTLISTLILFSSF
jgi:hypothetical protein